MRERERQREEGRETKRPRDRYLFAGSSDSSSLVYRAETFDKLKAAINLKPANFRPFFPFPLNSIKRVKRLSRTIFFSLCHATAKPKLNACVKDFITYETH